MSYILDFTKEAEEGLAKLKKSEPAAFKKASKLLAELTEHPTIGTGKPEQLKGSLFGKWSRKITDRHRLVYSIEEEIVVVNVMSVYGHYGDK